MLLIPAQKFVIYRTLKKATLLVDGYDNSYEFKSRLEHITDHIITVSATPKLGNETSDDPTSRPSV